MHVGTFLAAGQERGRGPSVGLREFKIQEKNIFWILRLTPAIRIGNMVIDICGAVPTKYVGLVPPSKRVLKWLSKRTRLSELMLQLKK
jgi:hypothetical protein